MISKIQHVILHWKIEIYNLHLPKKIKNFALNGYIINIKNIYFIIPRLQNFDLYKIDFLKKSFFKKFTKKLLFIHEMFLLYLQTITKFKNKIFLTNFLKTQIHKIFNKLNKNKKINMFCKLFNINFNKKCIKIKKN